MNTVMFFGRDDINFCCVRYCPYALFFCYLSILLFPSFLFLRFDVAFLGHILAEKNADC